MNRHPVYDNLIISKTGDVWTERYSKNPNRVTLSRKGYILGGHRCDLITESADRYGYCTVTVAVDGLGRIRKKVHRLVLETYKPNVNSESLVCDHKDNNPKNNNLSNLQWVTRSQNNKKGRKVKHADNDVRFVALKLMLLEGLTIKECSKYTGIRTNTLAEARREQTWVKAWERFNDHRTKYAQAY